MYSGLPPIQGKSGNFILIQGKSGEKESFSVHTQKKLVHKCQFLRTPLFARVIALTYLDLHVRFKICVSAKESFLLLQHVKYFI